MHKLTDAEGAVGNADDWLNGESLPADLSLIPDDVFTRLMSGDHIFGDDFVPTSIDRWFEDEKSASYACYEGVDTTQYDALNWIHAFRRVKHRKFENCLAIGVADGKDVEPLAHQVGRFFCVEPEEKWWRPIIGGKPAYYRAPNANGSLDTFHDGFFDLSIAIGCLHHIPNVSHIISEMGRTTASGGYLIVREPVTMMGDWRFPRPNMTTRERGLPPRPLLQAVKRAGFKPESIVYFDCPLVARGGAKLGVKPFNSTAFVLLDWLLCRALRWNMHYRPRSTLQKVAPSSVFIVARKV